MRAYFKVAMGAMLAACGSSTTNPGAAPVDSGARVEGDAGGGVDSGVGTTPTDGGGNPSPDAGPAIDAGPPGTGTATGSANGTPFGNVATALWIGAPDSAATTVVYVFNNPVDCATLGSPGWDGRIKDQTQVLEMKMFGTSPATYKVVTTTTPAPGEASVNHTLSSALDGGKSDAGSVETPSKSGTVTLSALTATKSASGSFALVFGANNISGTYNAVFCAGGRMRTERLTTSAVSQGIV